MAVLKQQLEGLKRQNLFYYFEPNDGNITEEGRQILSRYLKPEDVPDRIDSQLDAILCRANVIGISGGNRSAKTTTATIMGIIMATGELPIALEQYREHFSDAIDMAHRKVILGRVMAVDAKQLNRVVLPAWQQWIPNQYLKNGKWEDSYSRAYDILTLYRDGKVCARVEFLTNTQDTSSGQGNDLDFAIFDEEPDRDKYKETLMRFGTAERLCIIIAWTPTKGITWATEIFHAALEGRKAEDEEEDDTKVTRELFKLTTVNNKAVNPKTIVRIMDEFAEVSAYEEMKMRLLGEAISLSGLVYGNLFDHRTHVIEPFFENLSDHEKKEYLCLSGWDLHLVTPMAGAFALVDRENNVYIDRCYFRSVDTDDFKSDVKQIIKDCGYRMGWSVADKSSDSSIMAFGGRNIFQEVSRGKDAIPALRPSIKFEGSIKAGVDEIKKRLKINPTTQKPRFFIVNRPENKLLIGSMRTLERDTYNNEDDKGPKDRIKEGKHHLHAAMRYLFQFPIRWYPAVDEVVPVPEERFI